MARPRNAPPMPRIRAAIKRGDISNIPMPHGHKSIVGAFVARPAHSTLIKSCLCPDCLPFALDGVRRPWGGDCMYPRGASPHTSTLSGEVYVLYTAYVSPLGYVHFFF